MDKFDNANVVSANPSAAQAERQAGQARAGVLNLDDSQLALVGGGDNTPNWTEPPPGP